MTMTSGVIHEVRRTPKPHDYLEATPAVLFGLIQTTPGNTSNAALWTDDHTRYLKQSHPRQCWVGATYDDIMARRDWPEGRNLMAMYSCELAKTPECASIRRKRRWAANGDEFDRDRFDAGYEDCWVARKRERVATGGHVLSITLNIGGHCRRTAAELAWTGAAGVLLVDRLEAAGYRCEVRAVDVGLNLRQRSNPNFVVLVVPIKAADEPLDIDRLLFVSSCPAFFRWHCFRLMMDLPAAVRDDLGHHADVPQWARGDVHLAACHSQPEAQAELNRVIAAF